MLNNLGILSMNPQILELISMLIEGEPSSDMGEGSNTSTV